MRLKNQQPGFRRQDIKPEIIQEGFQRQEDKDDYYTDKNSMGSLIFFILLILAFFAIIVIWVF